MVVIVKNSVYRKDGINKLKLTLIANYILLHYTNREDILHTIKPRNFSSNAVFIERALTIFSLLSKFINGFISVFTHTISNKSNVVDTSWRMQVIRFTKAKEREMVVTYVLVEQLG
ncbi:MAG: hypothetical protein CBC48_21240 [bacterium TMED88]|nr:MAG: hypothetical protein CBC48_21240 [bacterium TMED88]